jgi:DNA-directed RNA polymerase
MSSDICRGLLEFAEGKPIGPNGLRWLKIHLANKMGKDKLSMQERILYVDSMLPIVERCVKDPLKYREWLEVEDCWQTLAAMNDLMEALSKDNPAEHISHIHIHQDGSCNGLQHYAALGRDYAGAEQVNLVSREKPGDIYTAVANMVQQRIDGDAENPSAKHHKLAKKLVGNVKRKIVKQTVMTSVYGVTFIGARKQIQKQLRDKEFLDQGDDREVYDASHYIASLTLDCIRDLFSGAHEIKKWLIACAGLIANTANPVSWITPLG